MRVLIIGLGKIGSFLKRELEKEKGIEVFGISESGEKLPSNLDYIIILFSSIGSEKRKEFAKSHPKENPRKLEFKGNVKILKDYLDSLKKIPRKTKIIVVSNPADKMTNYLQNKLPSREVIGFGMQLDKKRISNQYGKRVDCVGVHGKAIPLIKKRSEKAYINLREKAQNQLIKDIKVNGLSSKESARKILKLIKNINNKDKKIINVCYRLKEPFYGIKNKSISLPFVIENGKIVCPKNIKLNEIEIKLLKEVIKNET
jgi:malate/lactate dehydrogenase